MHRGYFLPAVHAVGVRICGNHNRVRVAAVSLEANFTVKERFVKQRETCGRKQGRQSQEHYGRCVLAPYCHAVALLLARPWASDRCEYACWQGSSFLIARF